MYTVIHYRTKLRDFVFLLSFRIRLKKNITKKYFIQEIKKNRNTIYELLSLPKFKILNLDLKKD